jgi:hypothetical protein
MKHFWQLIPGFVIMHYQLADSGASVMVMLDTFYPIVRAIRTRTALGHIIITSPADILPPMQHALYPLTQWHARQLEPRLTGKEFHMLRYSLHWYGSHLEACSFSYGSSSAPSCSTCCVRLP